MPRCRRACRSNSARMAVDGMVWSSREGGTVGTLRDWAAGTCAAGGMAGTGVPGLFGGTGVEVLRPLAWIAMGVAGGVSTRPSWAGPGDCMSRQVTAAGLTPIGSGLGGAWMGAGPGAALGGRGGTGAVLGGRAGTDALGLAARTGPDAIGLGGSGFAPGGAIDPRATVFLVFPGGGIVGVSRRSGSAAASPRCCFSLLTMRRSASSEALVGWMTSPAGIAWAGVVAGACKHTPASSGTRPAGSKASMPSRHTGTSLPIAPERKVSFSASRDRARCTPFRSTQRHRVSEATLPSYRTRHRLAENEENLPAPRS
jgi:hypothetical protein